MTLEGERYRGCGAWSRRYHPWMRDLRALPKAELHIHMEGAMRVATVLELVERNGVPVPSGLTETGWRFSGPSDFIAQYIAVCGLMTRLEDLPASGPGGHRGPRRHRCPLRRGGVHAVGACRRRGRGLVRPDRGTAGRARRRRTRDRYHGAAHPRRGARCRDGRGTAHARGRTEVTPAAASWRSTVRAARWRRSPRSRPCSPKPRGRPGFGTARRRMGGTRERVGDAEHYAPDRIGHGVRAIDDPRLVERLAERGSRLEVSPLSNVATGVFPSLEAHPFLRLRNAGVVVTLNSDDPPMFGDGGSPRCTRPPAGHGT